MSALDNQSSTAKAQGALLAALKQSRDARSKAYAADFAALYCRQHDLPAFDAAAPTALAMVNPRQAEILAAALTLDSKDSSYSLERVKLLRSDNAITNYLRQIKLDAIAADPSIDDGSLADDLAEKRRRDRERKRQKRAAARKDEQCKVISKLQESYDWPADVAQQQALIIELVATWRWRDRGGKSPTCLYLQQLIDGATMAEVGSVVGALCRDKRLRETQNGKYKVYSCCLDDLTATQLAAHPANVHRLSRTTIIMRLANKRWVSMPLDDLLAVQLSTGGLGGKRS